MTDTFSIEQAVADNHHIIVHWPPVFYEHDATLAYDGPVKQRNDTEVYGLIMFACADPPVLIPWKYLRNIPRAAAEPVEQTHDMDSAAVLLLERAKGNLQKWGTQDTETLCLAIAEETGELAQAILQARHEGKPMGRIQAEAVDLGALCLQVLVGFGPSDELDFPAAEPVEHRVAVQVYTSRTAVPDARAANSRGPCYDAGNDYWDCGAGDVVAIPRTELTFLDKKIVAQDGTPLVPVTKVWEVEAQRDHLRRQIETVEADLAAARSTMRTISEQQKQDCNDLAAARAEVERERHTSELLIEQLLSARTHLATLRREVVCDVYAAQAGGTDNDVDELNHWLARILERCQPDAEKVDEPINVTEVLEELSQAQGNPPYQPAVTTSSSSQPDDAGAIDVEAMRANLHATFNGGHHDKPEHSAFHHGMDTVCNVLAAKQKGQQTNGILPTDDAGAGGEKRPQAAHLAAKLHALRKQHADLLALWERARSNSISAVDELRRLIENDESADDLLFQLDHRVIPALPAALAALQENK